MVPSGYDPKTRITEDFINDKLKAVDFFKKMATHESPEFAGMSDDDWENAWMMWKSKNA